MKTCLWCNKELPAKKQKYCNDLCRYRYVSWKNDKPKKLSLSQYLRMAKAGKAQAKGKIGVRFN